MGWLILIFMIGIPLVELFIMIEIGSSIGGLGVVLLSLATAALGITLVREQGLKVIRDVQNSTLDGNKHFSGNGADPIQTGLIHGFFLLIAGLLLLFPGFVTDAIGGILLIPPVRLFLGRLGLAFVIARHIHVDAGFSGKDHKQQTTTIIEGEIIYDDQDIDKNTDKDKI